MAIKTFSSRTIVGVYVEFEVLCAEVYKLVFV